jgi:hypothetical protein
MLPGPRGTRTTGKQFKQRVKRRKIPYKALLDLDLLEVLIRSTSNY